MKYDEFAFVNHQLAGMLKAGIPLEGALRQLCATMRRGDLRNEFTQLEADLAQGRPFSDALAARKLPPFYVSMVRVGVASQDLPAVLILLADYYQRTGSIWTRLKGMMVYPLIVLGVAFAMSLAVSLILYRVMDTFSFEGFGFQAPSPAAVWLAPATLAILIALLGAALLRPAWRARLRWRLPGFREAQLAQVASALSLLLSRGCPLNKAIDLVQQLEANSPAGAELARWQERLASGRSKIQDFAAGGQVFPPLFVWLASSGHEDLVAGFKRAGEMYSARALHRIEMQLYAFLPVSVLFLGVMIAGQVYPLIRIFGTLASMLDPWESLE